MNSTGNSQILSRRATLHPGGLDPIVCSSWSERDRLDPQWSEVAPGPSDVPTEESEADQRDESKGTPHPADAANPSVQGPDLVRSDDPY